MYIKRTLQGQGLIAGVLYLPGAFHGYTSEFMSDLVDRKMDISGFFPFDADAAQKRIVESSSNEERIVYIEELLCSHIPKPDEKVDELNKIIGASWRIVP